MNDILRKCLLFRQLTDESIKLLCSQARIARFKKGALILRQGDECPGFYCVGSGAVRVYKIAPNGKEHVLHFAKLCKTSPRAYPQANSHRASWHSISGDRLAGLRIARWPTWLAVARLAL